jgi:hypothetical protein
MSVPFWSSPSGIVMSGATIGNAHAGEHGDDARMSCQEQGGASGGQHHNSLGVFLRARYDVVTDVECEEGWDLRRRCLVNRDAQMWPGKRGCEPCIPM